MITGESWFKVPESLLFIFQGTLPEWVGGKDLILYLIGRIGVDGALYQAMEFTGQAIAALPMSDRLAMCNMAIEAGAKNGIIAPDEVTREYVANRALRPFTFYASDRGTEYAGVQEINVSRLEPQVAFPHLPENTRPISEVGEIPIDQAVIGPAPTAVLRICGWRLKS